MRTLVLMVDATALRRSRAAVTGLFFLTGLGVAMWVVSIPAVQATTGASHGVLGVVLLMLGLGSFIGMQVSGPVVDRVGSKIAVGVGAVILAGGLTIPGFATSAWVAGVGLFVFGLGHGLVEVAMNVQAVELERRYGRPVMSSFHAFFSIGGAVGAGVGALLQTLSLSVHWTLGFGSVIALVVAVLALPHLVPTHNLPAPSAGNAADDLRRIRVRVVVLSGLAFLLMLAEGTANDWSSLQSVTDLHTTEAAGSVAFGCFAVAMTIGRLSADTVVRHLGPVRVVRYGAVVAAVGMGFVVFTSSYPFTLLGWTVFGLGLSGIVPQIFTAAGNVSAHRQGIIIARVSGTGYLGLLAGPAIIGWISQLTGITAALLTPLLICLIGAVFAGVVAGRSRTPSAELAATQSTSMLG